jgi:hypothetical protein
VKNTIGKAVQAGVAIIKQQQTANTVQIIIIEITLTMTI